jgi:hypothetical protein
MKMNIRCCIFGKTCFLCNLIICNYVSKQYNFNLLKNTWQCQMLTVYRAGIYFIFVNEHASL